MHVAMMQLNLPSLVQEACDVAPDPAVTPAATYQKLVREGTEKVKLTEMAGRIPAVMLVPYPPGIPIRRPGERLEDPNSPTIRFLLALEEFSKRFPEFEREVHGHRTRHSWRILGAERDRGSADISPAAAEAAHPAFLASLQETELTFCPVRSRAATQSPCEWCSVIPRLRTVSLPKSNSMTTAGSSPTTQPS